MSRDSMHGYETLQLMRQLRGQKENIASPIVACALEHIYGSAAWQWVLTLQY
jgi:hypothetical protein